ncbi:hypothetical protein OAory_01036750 [Aspergillus oryzae]|uniref:Uncharacterized protein n=1 Tax=Aspergillus oryzae TaxID=5062 RepID=A0A1S9E1C9_ASPOZ|nr:hypothetical protein OAory_01036750 [Aspergillus oryzae]
MLQSHCQNINVRFGMTWTIQGSPFICNVTKSIQRGEMPKTTQQFTDCDYTVGWICALPETDLVASAAMLDEEHPTLPAADPQDANSYLLGHIGECSEDEEDSDDETKDTQDLRLWDVVVSLHSKPAEAIVQYDFGKSLQGKEVVHTGGPACIEGSRDLRAADQNEVGLSGKHCKVPDGIMCFEMEAAGMFYAYLRNLYI